MRETPAQKLQRLEKDRRVGDSDKREEEAVRKILSGDALTAVSLLQKIEQETPGKYSTAANLGTAYELAGDNPNALKWISEGIRRNAKSHHGTEWLHVLILETKLRLETDPEYLKTHRIIPLPEKFGAETKIDVSGTERSVQDVVQALGYQLIERVVFVKPPDPIVADLLFTLALCEARTGVLQGAVKLLKKSQEYGFQDPALLEATLKQYEDIIKKSPTGRSRSR
jgi:tetratricopeptide (TPR) repeat protein